MAFWKGFRRGSGSDVTEAIKALTPSQLPERTGYTYGIPRGGLNEYNAGIGASTQTDRRSMLQQLYEAFLSCPWSWACVNAIARTITAGGLVMDWDTDTGEGDQDEPEKPENVKAAERLFAFTNDRQNIRQLLRNVVIDLLVFGDALIEVSWWNTTPVALYNLDVPTTTPTADEHGKITGWTQTTDTGLIATFEPRDVIHISLDAPRSGVFGVSPTQAALLPITAWLFAAATLKEMFRKGLPPVVHADFPAGVSKTDQELWVAQAMARNVGPRNIGRPWVTKGGGKLVELQAGKVADALAALTQKRDEILASYGVPPALATVIESGNLGGGTGEEQRRTYEVDTCAPIGELVLEALNYAVIQNGLGVEEWHAKFGEVDYRASQTVEAIRDMRLRNGAYTLNKYRTEIGEPSVDGGDEAVLVDRQNLVLWKDMARMSEAMVDSKSAGGALAAAAGMQMQDPPAGQEPPAPAAPQVAKDGGEPQESVPVLALARYRRRLAEALNAMPVTEASGGLAGKIRAMLAPDFPPATTAWITDDATSWTGP